MQIIKKIKRGFNRIKASVKTDSILVYQMGKVGSTTLVESIPGAVHLHTLYINPPCKELLKIERPDFFMKMVGFCYDLLRQFAVKFRKDVKIITVIRNPIERNVSMFFQDLPYWYVKYRRLCPNASRFSDVDVIQDMFEKVFPHEYPDLWFDKEIKRLTGIDVYSTGYDAELGYLKLEKGKYKVLLLEMTKINDRVDVIEEFLGYKIDLVNVNVGNKKWYAPLYVLHKERLINNLVAEKIVKAGRFYKKFYNF